MASLHLTRHAQSRVRQRGVREADLDLIYRFGTEVADGVVLRQEDVIAVEQEVKLLVNRLHTLKGRFIAVHGDTVLTTYKPSRGQLRRRLNLQ